ncbi:hypothetical protein [Lachnoclostridium sp. MSJ-17]|uniref:hypothetical protein n=1 Tax=Lachnoclostridium sp. MSJ-17 TaxID=2841516 RepID=UPI001C105D6B|nr:hypothetical protein [Lachnoclostridium sp. MSJ-17]MBU5461284.1 hypothetical protein [Lachnoclostridium sp. MSJ-17]
MTAIKRYAIDLLMNLSDAEILAILEKYELTKPDSTAKVDASAMPRAVYAGLPYEYDKENEFFEALEE